MTTIEFILDGSVVATKQTQVAKSQADTAGQYDEGQRVIVNGTTHTIERINHNTDADTVEVYLSNALG